MPTATYQEQDGALMATTDKLGTMQTRTLHVLSGGGNGESMFADGMGDPNFDADLGRVEWFGEGVRLMAIVRERLKGVSGAG
jgi:hypothetical protein